MFVGTDPFQPNCESDHGPKMVHIITGCLKYQTRSRLDMSTVTQILEGKMDAFRENRGVQLLCLGTGKGVTGKSRVYTTPLLKGVLAVGFSK